MTYRVHEMATGAQIRNGDVGDTRGDSEVRLRLRTMSCCTRRHYMRRMW